LDPVLGPERRFWWFWTLLAQYGKIEA